MARREPLQPLQLFDVQRDPWELENALAQQPERAAEMLKVTGELAEGDGAGRIQTLFVEKEYVEIMNGSGKGQLMYMEMYK